MLKHGAELAGWMLLATGMGAAVLAAMEDALPVTDMVAVLSFNQ